MFFLLTPVQEKIKGNLKTIRKPFGSWNELLMSWFDGLFGEKHISPRCAIACMKWSLSFFSFMLVCWYLSDSPSFFKTIKHPNGIFMLGVIALLVNFPTDFLSLLQTRFFIKKANLFLTKKANLKSQFFKGMMFLVADLLATALILTITCLFALLMMWLATGVFSMIGFSLRTEGVGGQFTEIPSLLEIYQRSIVNGWKTGFNFYPLHKDSSPPITGSLMVFPTFFPFVFAIITVLSFFLRELIVRLEVNIRIFYRNPSDNADPSRIFLLVVAGVTFVLILTLSIVVKFLQT